MDTINLTEAELVRDNSLIFIDTNTISEEELIEGDIYEDEE